MKIAPLGTSPWDIPRRPSPLTNTIFMDVLYQDIQQKVLTTSDWEPVNQGVLACGSFHDYDRDPS